MNSDFFFLEVGKETQFLIKQMGRTSEIKKIADCWKRIFMHALKEGSLTIFIVPDILLILEICMSDKINKNTCPHRTDILWDGQKNSNIGK